METSRTELLQVLGHVSVLQLFASGTSERWHRGGLWPTPSVEWQGETGSEKGKEAVGKGEDLGKESLGEVSKLSSGGSSEEG